MKHNNSSNTNRLWQIKHRIDEIQKLLKESDFGKNMTREELLMLRSESIELAKEAASLTADRDNASKILKLVKDNEHKDNEHFDPGYKQKLIKGLWPRAILVVLLVTLNVFNFNKMSGWVQCTLASFAYAYILFDLLLRPTLVKLWDSN